MTKAENGRESSRRFRARVLRINEPVSVYYFDSTTRRQQPELYRWLLSEEGQRQVPVLPSPSISQQSLQDQVQVVAHDGQVLKSEPWLEPSSAKKFHIKIPGWKTCSEFVSPSVNSDIHLPISVEPPYRRSQCFSRSYLADDEDDDWLRNTHITVEIFERIILDLERLHFKVLRSKRSARVENGRVYVEVPPEDVVLPLETAMQCLQRYKQEEVDVVYAYWLAKRNKWKKPLVQELWSRFPWSVVLDHSFKADCPQDKESLETPFIGASTHAQTSSTRIQLEEQLRRMCLIREDLEVARTLADQVRKREKLTRMLENVKLEKKANEFRGVVSCENQPLLGLWTTEFSHNEDTNPRSLPCIENQKLSNTKHNESRLKTRTKRRSYVEEGLGIKRRKLKHNTK